MNWRNNSLVSSALRKLHKNSHEVVEIKWLHPVPINRPDKLHCGFLLWRGACSTACKAAPEMSLWSWLFLVSRSRQFLLRALLPASLSQVLYVRSPVFRGETPEGIKNWAVTSAPAEVTIKDLFNLISWGRGVIDSEAGEVAESKFQMQWSNWPFYCIVPMHGHNKSWGTVAALCPVVADKLWLHLIQVANSAHSLHSCDGPAITFEEWRYTLQAIRLVKKE